jgi:hypothetical protein
MPNPTTERGTAPTTATTTDTSSSAFDLVKNALAQYGLESLASWAWDAWTHGTSEAELWLQIRDRPEYKARFPGMDELRKQGSAITESNYIQTENTYKEVMHSYGLPKGFYDSPDDFGALISGHVSPTELRDRVQVYSQVALGDSETLNQLRTLYADQGIPRNAESDLLAYYLDPNKAAPILQQQFASAQFASAAAKSGYGQLSKDQAEEFGAKAGTSQQGAQQGFGALVQSRELFGALPGQGETDINQQTQLGAAFGGDALAQQQIEKRRSERKAAGSGGGGFSQSRTGAATGLTSTQV